MTKNDAVERAINALETLSKKSGAALRAAVNGNSEACEDVCTDIPAILKPVIEALLALQTSRPDAGERKYQALGWASKAGATSPEEAERIYASYMELKRQAGENPPMPKVLLDADDMQETLDHFNRLYDAIVIDGGGGIATRVFFRDRARTIRAALKSGEKGRWQDKYGYMPVGEAIEHAHAMREKYLAEHDGDEPATAEIVRWYCSEAHRLSKSFAPPTSEGV